MSSVKKIGIFCKDAPAVSREIITKLVKWLKDRNFEILMNENAAAITGEPSSHEEAEIPGFADLIIVLGGDGTLLHVARTAHPHNVPVLTVNLGTLGFLTEFTLADMENSLDKILTGDFPIENRMLMSACLWRKDKKIGDYNVLNEVVINGGALSRIINLEVHVDGQHMTSYRADGLIIATPTGSTAHSLSARGPIIHPKMHALVLSPICPFALTSHPIVVPDDSEIKVSPTVASEDIYITLDGQEGCDLKKDDMLVITKAKNYIQLIKSPARNYYNVLREKLHWGRGIEDITTDG
ncbi:MAG: NAD(+)/NADH kinase [Nitrospinota bacterium]|nr:NAD(+)/NADH kinase [Nitrospinota bacterium]